METLYRKVKVSERLSKEEKWYHVIDEDGNVDLCPFRRGGFSATDTIGQKEVKFWLEPIPDPTAQLKADKEELLEALEEMYSNGTGWIFSHKEYNEIETLIQKIKQ